MTAADLETRVLERLDQPGGASGHYTAQEALAAINEGIRFFTLLTLGLEATTTFAISDATAFYHMQPLIADWMLPLRMRISGGAYLRPARLDELDALNPAWEAVTGTPERYAALGFDLCAFHKLADATIETTYARHPIPLAADSDEPEYPADLHPAFADYGVYRLRFREGGQEFAKTLPYLGRFMEEAQRYGDYIRARGMANRYDKLPPQLERFDLSKLLTFRKDLMPQRSNMNGR
jgi:hypothetical protein